ncbi:MAG: hypothetical protein ABJA49_07990 [Betaproteobacteria bacterium]
MNMNTTIENTQRLAHDAAQGTGDLIRSTRHNAEGAIGKLDDKVQQLRADAVPAFERAGEQATRWARRSAQQVRHGSRQLQAKANYAAQETQQFVRDQPVKSVLIAAGVGVLVMGLVSLFARQGSRD